MVDMQKLMAGKMQMEAVIQAEVRQTAREVFVGLLLPYLERAGNSPEPKTVRDLADLAMKCAPYLHQASGMVDIDDEKHWAKG